MWALTRLMVRVRLLQTRNGDDASVISGLVYATPATINSNIGTYAIDGSGASSTNYVFDYTPGELTVEASRTSRILQDIIISNIDVVPMAARENQVLNFKDMENFGIETNSDDPLGATSSKCESSDGNDCGTQN